MARRKKVVVPSVYVYYNEAAETYWLIEETPERAGGQGRSYREDGFRVPFEERGEEAAFARAAALLGCDRFDLDITHLANDPDREELDAYGSPIPQENYRCTVDVRSQELTAHLAEIAARKREESSR